MLSSKNINFHFLIFLLLSLIVPLTEYVFVYSNTDLSSGNIQFDFLTSVLGGLWLRVIIGLLVIFYGILLLRQLKKVLIQNVSFILKVLSVLFITVINAIISFPYIGALMFSATLSF